AWCSTFTLCCQGAKKPKIWSLVFGAEGLGLSFGLAQNAFAML
ncbi:hypothetical protein HMPREF9104_00277, partial [Lentilactobacillus kisonensis F0435]